MALLWKCTFPSDWFVEKVIPCESYRSLCVGYTKYRLLLERLTCSQIPVLQLLWVHLPSYYSMLSIIKDHQDNSFSVQLSVALNRKWPRDHNDRGNLAHKPESKYGKGPSKYFTNQIQGCRSPYSPIFSTRRHRQCNGYGRLPRTPPEWFGNAA